MNNSVIVDITVMLFILFTLNDSPENKFYRYWDALKEMLLLFVPR